MVRKGRFQMSEGVEKLDQGGDFRSRVAAVRDGRPFEDVFSEPCGFAAAQTSRSIGQDLQNWLLRNKIDVTHDLFVPAVDLAFRNAGRVTAGSETPVEGGIKKEGQVDSWLHFDLTKDVPEVTGELFFGPEGFR
jgi:hypothetical protein